MAPLSGSFGGLKLDLKDNVFINAALVANSMVSRQTALELLDPCCCLKQFR
jgi:hypothetical protein